MKWESIKDLSPAVFRRLTGVKDTTFIEIVAILQKAHDKKKQLGGRPNKLCIADMLLMTLEYLREYRTYLHIGKSYGISESNAYKIIKWVEDTLIKSKVFNLPGRKALLKSDMQYEVILVDATETSIQRSKKSNVTTTTTQEKRRDTL